MMKPYTGFAEVYDLMGADQHSLDMVDYSFKIFDKFDINPTTGLDLCCGTGAAISKFIEYGIIMSGLDRSPEMLERASKKLKRKKIKLYQKSLPNFKIHQAKNSKRLQKFDLITSFFDSLNYLTTERELKAAFKSVHAHLNPNGWFIFDMNTAEALKILWSSQVYADAKDDMAWVWKNDYNAKKKLASCHATFFIKEGKNYKRVYELHKERAYSNTTIKQMLRDVGFQIKGFYECFSFDKLNRKTTRLAVVVKKK